MDWLVRLGQRSYVLVVDTGEVRNRRKHPDFLQRRRLGTYNCSESSSFSLVFWGEPCDDLQELSARQ